jgi:hypothetical protein
MRVSTNTAEFMLSYFYVPFQYDLKKLASQRRSPRYGLVYRGKGGGYRKGLQILTHTNKNKIWKCV